MAEIMSNATPLIAFAKIGQLNLMRQVVGTLMIPEAVAEEISTYTSTGPGYIALADEPWIRVQPLQSNQQLQSRQRLVWQGAKMIRNLLSGCMDVGRRRMQGQQ